MKNSTVENMVSEVTMTIKKLEGYALAASEVVRASKALLIMGRITQEQLKEKEEILKTYQFSISEAKKRLAALEELR